MVVVTTDLVPPDDFDDFRLEVQQGDLTLHGITYHVGTKTPADVLLPATLAIVEGSKPDQVVRIRLTASRSSTVVLVKTVVTQVPQNRIARVVLSIDYACLNSAARVLGNREVASCPSELTCDRGVCVDPETDVTTLPDYTPEDVFGGATGPDAGGTCFDVTYCFSGSTTITNAAIGQNDQCRASIPDGFTLGNAGLLLPPSPPVGNCNGARCVVPLDYGPDGYTQDGQDLILPRLLCIDRNGDHIERALVLAATCGPKKSSTPTCGVWSSTGRGTGTDAGTVTLNIAARAPTMDVGSANTCALRDGTVWCAGKNGNGQLGNGTRSDSPQPKAVTGLGNGVTGLCVSDHACAMTASEIRCWGANGSGQLGFQGADRDTPGPAVPAPQKDAWGYLSCGTKGTCAISATGLLQCWGSFGQGSSGSYAPQLVAPDMRWSRVSVGRTHACAIEPSGRDLVGSDRPGRLFCWGENDSGQLGIGSTTTQTTPTQVGKEDDWLDVYADELDTCGIRSSGDVYCWGRRLGTPDRQSSTTPKIIESDRPWRRVAVNSQSLCLIARDGSLWCSGQNANGQLGLGNTSELRVLTEVGVGLDWSEVALGDQHMCVRTGAGDVSCTGVNGSGQLGTGDNQSTNVLLPSFR